MDLKRIFDLSGKVAIVTGGNGGIGKGIARGLASAGADIAIAARNENKTALAVKEIQQDYGVKVIGVTVDLHDEASIGNMVEKVLAAFSRINILANNAGINIRKLPQEYMSTEWDEVINVNLRGTFLCSKAVYPAMKAAGGGKIINTGSMTSLFSGPMLAPYSASKGAVVQLTKSLATAWAKENIQVNAILPGFINTDLAMQARKDMAGFDRHVKERTPVGRWGEVEELAGAAVFFASRASDFITGTALPIDGGFSAAM